jgi:hypothetical protein
MNKEEFLRQPDISAFIIWLVQNLPDLRVHLRVSRSRYVPESIDQRCVGFENLLTLYAWNNSWDDGNHIIHSCDWPSTQQSLARIKRNLQQAIANQNQQETLRACKNILLWGGVPASISFIEQQAGNDTLIMYLLNMEEHLSLTGENDDEDLNANTGVHFNAGMSKIHAVLDTTGLPIYDSRVGAAIAMLYRLFQQQNPNMHCTVNFPSGPARGNQIRNPKELNIGFQSAPQFYTPGVSAHKWAQTQLRLGWIVRAVLEQVDWLHNQGTMENRCHAFEACLFMLGYDLRAFILDPVGGGQHHIPENEPNNRQRRHAARHGWVPTVHNFTRVIGMYFEFCRQLEPNHNNAINHRQQFIQWMHRERNFKKSTASAYCFPLSEREFDLFGRPINEVEIIAQGGREGLTVAMRDRVIETEDRARVCLVDVCLAGRLANMTNAELRKHLQNHHYAGTDNAANAIIYVGRCVGRHFGLFDDHNLPTNVFHRFFRGLFLDL